MNISLTVDAEVSYSDTTTYYTIYLRYKGSPMWHPTGISEFTEAEARNKIDPVREVAEYAIVKVSLPDRINESTKEV